MSDVITEAELTIGASLHTFLVDEALPGSGVDRDVFFQGLSRLIHEFGPRNAELLSVRQEMQATIDEWHVPSEAELGQWRKGAIAAWIDAKGTFEPEIAERILKDQGMDDFIAALKNAGAL